MTDYAITQLFPDSEFMQGYINSEADKNDTIAVKRVYIDINDGMISDGIMFSQIMYWHLPDKTKKKPTRLTMQRDGYYWLVKDYDEWWEECRIDERTARDCVKRMTDRNLIIKEVHAIDNHKHTFIRINGKVFGEKLQQFCNLSTDTIRDTVRSKRQKTSNANDGKRQMDTRLSDGKRQMQMTENVKTYIEESETTKPENTIQSSFGVPQEDSVATPQAGTLSATPRPPHNAPEVPDTSQSVNPDISSPQSKSIEEPPSVANVSPYLLPSAMSMSAAYDAGKRLYRLGVECEEAYHTWIGDPEREPPVDLIVHFARGWNEAAIARNGVKPDTTSPAAALRAEMGKLLSERNPVGGGHDVPLPPPVAAMEPVAPKGYKLVCSTADRQYVHLVGRDRVRPACAPHKWQWPIEYKDYPGAPREICPACLKAAEAKEQAKPPKADSIDKVLKDAVAKYIQEIDVAFADAFTGTLAQIIAGIWRTKLGRDKLTADDYAAIARSLEPQNEKGFIPWYRKQCKGCDIPNDKVKLRKWYAKFVTSLDNVTNEKETMGRPDPNCPHCKGRGVTFKRDESGTETAIYCECRGAK